MNMIILIFALETYLEDLFRKLDHFKKLHDNVLVKFLVFFSGFFLSQYYFSHENQSCVF